jgi:hypothetical protein
VSKCGPGRSPFLQNPPRTPTSHDADHARALHSLACLMELVVTAKQQTDVITWRRVGGMEAEDFLDAIERGGSHPLLVEWEARKTRPAAGMREEHARRIAVLLCLALHRGGLGMAKARKQTAKALERATDLFAAAPTDTAIKHWQQRQVPPTPEDARVIQTAFDRCGTDPHALLRHFVGLMRFARNPFP